MAVSDPSDGETFPGGPTSTATESDGSSPDVVPGPTGSELTAPSGDQLGTGAGETVTIAPPDDPSAVAIMLKPDGQPPPVPGERPLPTVDGYEILGELGRGGMGVVYRAREAHLNRPCVLKMILAGAHADAESIIRFRAEAEAVARLQHGNVVQIHHIGVADGLPFFELEYVDGGSLDSRLDGTPWKARPAAELVEAIARGVSEAHRLGIVHRDLKPANILLTAQGAPKITDFGLAKSMAGDSGLTRSGSIMGSPGYMAPEQAEGRTKQVGPPADVYALGAILYELMTGRPPFRGATILETLEQVRTAEPVPPSRLVPRLPRDVETIALKCLQKEPTKRYDSAPALAADLQRFLDGQSILARPVGAMERAWRWCRRHPVPAALSAAIFLVAALGLTGIVWQWREAVRARWEVEMALVDMYATSGLQAGDQGEYGRAALWFANAARRAGADPDRRRSNAIRAQTWGRRAFRPLGAVVAKGPGAVSLVYHPDGRYLITARTIDGNTGIAEHSLHDLELERSLSFPGGHATVRVAAWSPDGKSLAVGLEGGDVVVAGFPGGDHATRFPFPANVRRLAYSPDGDYLAVAGGNWSRVWDVRSRGFATPELVHPDEVTTLAFHPEGRLLATGCLDQMARLFAVPGTTGSPLWPPVPHRHEHEDASLWYRQFQSPPVFVDGGRALVTCGAKGWISWSDVGTGSEVRKQDFAEWHWGIASVVVSPDGRHLALFGAQTPSTVRLVEAATGRVVGPALEHKNAIMCAAFSADGRILATSSTDATVRLWAVPGGESLARPFDLHRSVSLVAFSPGGRSLATQDGDLVRLWELPEEGVPMMPVPLDGRDSFSAHSPDGMLAIPTGMTFPPYRKLRSTRAYHVATGRPAGPPLRPGGLVVDAAFSPDGRAVVTLSAGGNVSAATQEVVVWDWASGRQGWRAALPSEPRSVAYRPDGGLLAALCGGGELLTFDSQTGRELRRWRAHDAEPAGHWINNGKVGFSPDGRSILTWGMGNDLRVWEADTGRLRYPPVRHGDKCHDVQFSPDGRLIALASYDRSVRVRDFATGAVVAELPDHPDLVYSAGFSPDGQLLVTACRDRSVRVWDWRAGRLVCPPFEHAKEANAATFTPDGRWVLSASFDGTARAWDWRTGKPVTPPLTTGGEPLSVAVTPDGKHAVVAGFHNALSVLDLSGLTPTAVDADALCGRAELIAGQQFHEGGGTVNLSAAEWLGRWRALGRPGNPRGSIGAAKSQPKSTEGARATR